MSKDFQKYLGSLLLFGSNGIVASGIALSSLQVVLMRTLLGAVALMAVLGACALRRRSAGQGLEMRDHAGEVAALAVSGAALGVGWIFLFAAYRLVGVGVASLAYYCGPVIVMALSPVLFRERLTAGKLLGFAMVLMGAFLVVAQGQAASLNPQGLALGGLSAVMYAVMVIASKRAPHVGGIEAATVQLVAAFAAVAVCAVATGDLPTVGALAHANLASVLMLGLVNTGLGCYLYFSALGKLPVQRVAVCGYLEPLSAVVLSCLLLGEAVTPGRMLGTALIIGGAATCELLGKQGGLRLHLPRVARA